MIPDYSVEVKPCKNRVQVKVVKAWMATEVSAGGFEEMELELTCSQVDEFISMLAEGREAVKTYLKAVEMADKAKALKLKL